MTTTIRARLEKALAGQKINVPVYVVYDSFVIHRQIDWGSLFESGLGRINHAILVDIERPNLEIKESVTKIDGHQKKDIRWITGIGELTKVYIDGWQQEYFIKSPNDYKIMQRALESAKFKPTNEYFDVSESQLQEQGITVGHICDFDMCGYNRTPFQAIQIDFAGLERFSIDIMTEVPELIELIEMMNEQMLDIFGCILKTKAEHIKLWENLTIETMGPWLYRKHLTPLYRKIFDILDGSDKKLHVHYDGKLSKVAKDIATLPFDGLDSFTPAPEGDMTVAQARKWWPNKFLWLHPSLSWNDLAEEELLANIRQMISQAEGQKFCLQISEDMPPNWRTIPLILQSLKI